jgi:aminoglycoside phosphotransferase (APT) family kinase protein
MMIAVAERLHANEAIVDDSLVRRLLAEQFPEWAVLPMERVLVPGSDHVLYRLGPELVVRLPRKAGVDAQVDKEREWLPRLASQLPSAVPTPVAKGSPFAGYPFSWSVYRWLDGESPRRGVDSHELPTDLARFVAALRRIDTRGGPSAGEQNFQRGAPLARRDVPTRAAIAELNGVYDAVALTAAWDDALAAPPWHGPPAWVHGDLTPENLLVRDGRLAAVLDFGCLGVGDPACDLMVAWSLLAGEARSVFRVELGVDDASWRRGRGWALSTALIALPYYADSHPVRAGDARYRIEEVLADLQETLA